MSSWFALSRRNLGIAAVVAWTGTLQDRWRDAWSRQGGKVFADAIYVCRDEDEEDEDCEPGPEAQELTLDLKLRQLQVAFGPGACTPIYNLDGFKKCTYEEEFVARQHFLTTFPYRKQSLLDPCRQEDADWSDYEKQLQCQVLPGGSLRGQLSSYGQEQMLQLGLALKEDYKDDLDLTSFDPDDVFVRSANVRRHVVSAQCVLAGLFGKEMLTHSAQSGRPATVTVEDCDKVNLLTPDTRNCCLLQKVNLAAKNLHGDTPYLRQDRDRLEARIDHIQAKRLIAVTEAQERYDKLMQDAALSELEPHEVKEPAFNRDRQPYLRDERKDTVLAQRNDAIEQVELFWHNVFSNHDFLSGEISAEDFQALTYLRRIEIEEFHLMFEKGTRYKFHFDPNPYFYNRVLVKEVFNTDNPDARTSKSTNIRWKPNFRLYPVNPKVKDCGQRTQGSNDCNVCGGCRGDESGDNDDNDDKEKKGLAKKNRKSCVCAKGERGPSFFAWLVQDNDQFEPMGVIIKQDAWQNPLHYHTPTPYAPGQVKDAASSSAPLDFLSFRDDAAARHAHGYAYPRPLSNIHGLAEENGARILFYATTSQHELERYLVTKATAGRLLKAVLEKMLAVQQGCPSPPLHLYSCPHAMLTGLMEALGISDYQWPAPASELRFELYQDLNDEEDFYVRIVYQGQEQRCRGQCERFVHLGHFCRAIKPFTATQKEFQQICKSTILEKSVTCLLLPKGEKCRKEALTQLAQTPAGM